jgi:ornithine cyclodeaminase/alanine dehydrogenase-like protein (mu-crystallin family)
MNEEFRPGRLPNRAYEFLYIGNAEVKELLTPADSVRVAEQTLLDHYNGAVSFAATRQLDMAVPGEPTQYKAKGCVLARLGVAGFRVLSLNRTEEGYGVAGRRPTKHVLLSDMHSGEFFGIVDEHWSHALRTGACAAAAAKYLMLPGSDVLAITGAGYMAYASLVAMTAVMTPRRVQIWARNVGRAEAFAERARKELGLNAVATETPEQCVHDATVVITATSAPSPYLEKPWFAPGVFIYALGNWQEVDLATYQSMTFIVDEREQVRICGDIAKFIAAGTYDDAWVAADLGEVIARPDKRRQSAEEQIIVRSQGLVTQDVAQAFFIYQEARRLGRGVSLEASLTPQANAKLF